MQSSINVKGCKPDYYIPNTFTPNGDGFNDYFTLYANDAVRIIKRLQIFDKYGEFVFNAENIPPSVEKLGWNGTLRNKPFLSDVFVYRIEVEYADGKTEVFVGDVTIAE